MSPRRTLLLTLAVLALAMARARTQEAQIGQSRQLEALSTGLAPLVETIAPSSLVASSGRDSESLGVQQMLRDEERLRPFRVFADVSAFVTSNVALTRKDPLSDSFLLATFGFEYRRALSHGFQVETSLRAATFRYNEFRELDFNSVDAGLGVSYHAAKLGGIDVSVRYNFNELIGAEADEAFFKITPSRWVLRKWSPSARPTMPFSAWLRRSGSPIRRPPSGRNSPRSPGITCRQRGIWKPISSTVMPASLTRRATARIATRRSHLAYATDSRIDSALPPVLTSGGIDRTKKCSTTTSPTAAWG